MLNKQKRLAWKFDSSEFFPISGLIGGVKICSSEAKLPLEIKVEPIGEYHCY